MDDIAEKRVSENTEHIFQLIKTFVTLEHFEVSYFTNTRELRIDKLKKNNDKIEFDKIVSNSNGLVEKFDNKNLNNSDYICVSYLTALDEEMESKTFVILDFIDKKNTLFAKISLKTTENGVESVKSVIGDKFLSDYMYRINLSSSYILKTVDSLFDIIDIFAQLLMAKDNFMPYHMFNVCDISIILAVKLGISDEDKQRLMFASLLHDIGKLFVSDNIINKPTGLTEEEFKSIKNHPVIGEKMVNAMTSFIYELRDIPMIIRHHHEKYDGTGYPDGLCGKDIPLLSRIICVTDAIDAMRSIRSYKNRRSEIQIINELKKNSGSQFDPALVELAIDYLKENKVNKLNDFSFVPNVTIVIFLRNYSIKISVNGNLYLSDKSSKITFHNELASNIELDDKDLKAKVIYRLNNDYYDVDVDVIRVTPKYAVVSNIIYNNKESSFKIFWEFQLDLFFKDYSLKTSLIKLSAEEIYVLFKPENITNDMSVNNVFNEAIECHFTLEVDNLSESFNFAINFVDFNVIMDGYLVQYRFVNQTSSEKDKLFRLMFRKQIQQRRSIYA